MNWVDDPSESACVTSCIVKNLFRLWEMHCIALYWFFYFGLSVLVSFLPCDRLGRLCWRSLMVFQHLFHYERLGFGFPVCASFGQQRVLNERLILKEVFFCCQAEHTIEEKSCTSYNREAYNRQKKNHTKNQLVMLISSNCLSMQICFVLWLKHLNLKLTSPVNDCCFYSVIKVSCFKSLMAFFVEMNKC